MEIPAVARHLFIAIRRPRIGRVASHGELVTIYRSHIFPEKPKAPVIPFPRNVRRSWVKPYASCLPSRVPPILAAVSLSRVGRLPPTGHWALGTQVR